jgi:hypothetical protein
MERHRDFADGAGCLQKNFVDTELRYVGNDTNSAPVSGHYGTELGRQP